MILTNETSGKTLSHSVKQARLPWQRLIGLLSRRHIAADEGLYFERCLAVHTVGMRTAIDIVFLDRERRVLALHAFVQPGRTSVRCAGAVDVLEMGPGFIAMFEVAIGDRLLLEPPTVPVAQGLVRITLGDQTVLVDVDATRRLYAALAPPESRLCPCAECFSVSTQRNTILPHSFRSLLSRMGIDPTNEANLWAIAGHHYFFVSALFDFVGVSTAAPPRKNAAVRSLNYAFSNIASARGVQAARSLGLGAVASVRFDGRISTQALVPVASATNGMPHRVTADRRS